MVLVIRLILRVTLVTQSYNDGVNDEFVVPTVIEPEGMISDGDAVIFCNFRPDRARELTEGFNIT